MLVAWIRDRADHPAHFAIMHRHKRVTTPSNMIRSTRICICNFVVSYPSSHISWASAAASFMSATRIVRSKSRSLGKMARAPKAAQIKASAIMWTLTQARRR